MLEQGHMHGHARTHTLVHVRMHYAHAHSLKANSSETREDRPLCVQLTERITRRAKTPASCLAQQRWMAFRRILVQTVIQ